MKHAAKVLAVILVIFSLCSCGTNLPAISTESASSTPADEKWVNETVPLSAEMINCIKKIFDAVPSGTFLSAQKEKATGSRDLVLFDPNSKKEINLTTELHKIDNTATCTLSSDGSKILVVFYVYDKSGSFKRYSAVLNKNGNVLFSCVSQSVNCSDDLNYVAFYNSKSTYCINTESKEVKVFPNKMVSEFKSGYLWGTSRTDKLKDDSGKEISALSLWMYDLKAEKMISIKHNDSYIGVMSIKNNHAVLVELDGFTDSLNYDIFEDKNNIFYDFNLAIEKIKQISGGTAKARLNEPLPCGDFSAKMHSRYNNYGIDKVEIKDSKSNKTLLYPLDIKFNYIEFRWMQKK